MLQASLETKKPGFKTMTAAIPGTVSADAGTTAVSTVVELKVVAQAAPLKYTLAEGR